jgi:hypothetical protein
VEEAEKAGRAKKGFDYWIKPLSLHSLQQHPLQVCRFIEQTGLRAFAWNFNPACVEDELPLPAMDNFPDPEGRADWKLRRGKMLLDGKAADVAWELDGRDQIVLQFASARYVFGEGGVLEKQVTKPGVTKSGKASPTSRDKTKGPLAQQEGYAELQAAFAAAARKCISEPSGTGDHRGAGASSVELTVLWPTQPDCPSDGTNNRESARPSMLPRGAAWFANKETCSPAAMNPAYISAPAKKTHLPPETHWLQQQALAGGASRGPGGR